MFSDVRRAVEAAEDDIEKERFDRALIEIQTARMRLEDLKDAIETRNMVA